MLRMEVDRTKRSIYFPKTQNHSASITSSSHRPLTAGPANTTTHRWLHSTDDMGAKALQCARCAGDRGKLVFGITCCFNDA